MLAAFLSRRARAFVVTSVAIPLARWGWNQLQERRHGRQGDPGHEAPSPRGRRRR